MAGQQGGREGDWDGVGKDNTGYEVEERESSTRERKIIGWMGDKSSERGRGREEGWKGREGSWVRETREAKC